MKKQKIGLLIFSLINFWFDQPQICSFLVVKTLSYFFNKIYANFIFKIKVDFVDQLCLNFIVYKSNKKSKLIFLINIIEILDQRKI